MDIVAAYEKHKNLKLAADELGIKWQTLYFKLKKCGVKITGDKLRYGSDRDRLAARAEIEFQKIVPFAKNQNDTEYQSKFDFFVNGQKVDIKASKLNFQNKIGGSMRWLFSVKKQELLADFFVFFAFHENGYKCFLIPAEFAKNYQSINICQNGKSKWHQFEILPEDLKDFFKNI